MSISESGLLATLSVVTPFLLLIVTYLQYRIQSREFRPNLSVPKVAHYATVVGERENTVAEGEINDDEILFEVSNLGSGTATQVRAESELWVLNHGDVTDGELKAENDQSTNEDGPASEAGQRNHTDHSLVSLSEFEIPRSLTLDVTREDVYHSNWTETMEETIPGDQENTGYVTRLHVQSEDQSLSLDEVLTQEFPEKSTLRLKMRLVYTGRIDFRDRFSKLADSVIFPGVCDGLEEAMAAEIPYEQYERKSHSDAILDAKAEAEQYRQKNTADD